MMKVRGRTQTIPTAVKVVPYHYRCRLTLSFCAETAAFATPLPDESIFPIHSVSGCFEEIIVTP